MPNYFTQKIMRGAEVEIRNEDNPSSESSDPAVGSGQNFAQYRDVELTVIITGGSSPSVECTPLMINADGDAYRRGTASTFTGAGTKHVAQLSVNACTDFYILFTTVSGSPTNVTVNGEGIN